MSLLIAGILLATTIVHDEPDPGDACYQPRIAVAQARRIAYLDPTEGNRARIDEAIVEVIGGELLDRVESDPSSRECFTRLLLQIADERRAEGLISKLSRAESPRTRAIVEEYESFLRQKGIARGTLRDGTLDSVERAKKECTRRLLQDDCLSRLEHFARVGSPGIKPQLQMLAAEFAPAQSWLRWLSLYEAHPGRRERLLAALTDRDGVVVSWAMRELLSDPDPRRWEPQDVALIGQARALRDAGENAAELESGRVTIYFDERPSERWGLFELRALGVARAVEILGMRRLPTPQLESLIPMAHFMDEELLLRHESRTSTSETYMIDTWRDTDRRAPLPGLAAP